MKLTVKKINAAAIFAIFMEFIAAAFLVSSPFSFLWIVEILK